MGYVVDTKTGVAYTEENPPGYAQTVLKPLEVDIPLTSSAMDKLAQQKYPNQTLEQARRNICSPSGMDYHNDEVINLVERQLSDKTNTIYGIAPGTVANDLTKLRGVGEFLFILDDSGSMSRPTDILKNQLTAYQKTLLLSDPYSLSNKLTRFQEQNLYLKQILDTSLSINLVGSTIKIVGINNLSDPIHVRVPQYNTVQDKTIFITSLFSEIDKIPLGGLTPAATALDSTIPDPHKIAIRFCFSDGRVTDDSYTRKIINNKLCRVPAQIFDIFRNKSLNLMDTLYKIGEGENWQDGMDIGSRCTDTEDDVPKEAKQIHIFNANVPVSIGTIISKALTHSLSFDNEQRNFKVEPGSSKTIAYNDDLLDEAKAPYEYLALKFGIDLDDNAYHSLLGNFNMKSIWQNTKSLVKVKSEFYGQTIIVPRLAAPSIDPTALPLDPNCCARGGSMRI